MEYCVKSLSRGSDTFDLGRLHAILQHERFSYEHRTKVNEHVYANIIYSQPELSCVIDTSYFDFERLGTEGIRCFSNDHARLRATKFCRELYGHDIPGPISFPHLDNAFSRAFRFKFEPLNGSQTIVEHASSLLERLPARAPELTDTPTTVP